MRECQEGLKGVDVGIFMLHCMHTSAGLTVSDYHGAQICLLKPQVNENADP